MSTEHTAIPHPPGASPTHHPDGESPTPQPAGASPTSQPAGASQLATESAPIAAQELYTPLTDDEWTQDREELPPRPRRRLLGTGGNPVQVALLGVLLLACGFIGGVLVEKGQTSSSTTGGAAAGLASRFAALRGTSAGSSSAGNAGTPGTGSGFAGRFGGAAAGGATIGEVAYISGSTLYVSGTEGNTVKVTTSPASSVTKTVKSDIHGIHPGETVIVRGTKSAGGAVRAESISVSAGGVGAGAGGVGALFGGGAAASAGGTRASGGGGGEPALFGK